MTNDVVFDNYNLFSLGCKQVLTTFPLFDLFVSKFVHDFG